MKSLLLMNVALGALVAGSATAQALNPDPFTVTATNSSLPVTGGSSTGAATVTAVGASAVNTGT